jgi:hypothetical protein
MTLDMKKESGRFETISSSGVANWLRKTMYLFSPKSGIHGKGAVLAGRTRTIKGLSLECIQARSIIVPQELQRG